jgi:hypothetical protein
VIKDISINKISDPVLTATKYVTSLSTNSNISITTETVNPTSAINGSPTTLVNQDQVLQNEGTANQQVYSNGLGRTFIPDSIAFLRFTLYQKVNEQNTRMNLSGLGNLYIVFEDNLGHSLEFVEYPNQYTSKGGGEVVFRLSEKETKNVLSLQNRVFKIYLENDANERTFLYAGNFYSIAEYQDLAKNNKIVDLESQVSTLTSQISDLQSILSTQQTSIQGLVAQNSNLQSTLNNVTLTPINSSTTPQDVFNESQQIIDDKNQQIVSMQAMMDSLNSQISTMQASLANTMNALTQNNGVVTTQSTKTESTNTQESRNPISSIETRVSLANITPVESTLDKSKANLKNNPASNLSKDYKGFGSTSING